MSLSLNLCSNEPVQVAGKYTAIRMPRVLVAKVGLQKACRAWAERLHACEGARSMQPQAFINVCVCVFGLALATVLVLLFMFLRVVVSASVSALVSVRVCL